MNKSVLEPEVQHYILDNLKGDLPQLLLRKSPFSDVSMQEIVQQIKGRKVAEKKFSFLCKEQIYFPPQLNLEQASSESTGQYKASLVAGASMVDLTLGMGIDAFFIAQNFSSVDLVERNKDLLDIVAHNWSVLGKKASFIHSDLMDFLENNTKHFNLIYLDPARRDNQKKKVFLLEDLSPNIVEIQDRLLSIADRVLIKLSPLIDIAYLVSVLHSVEEIFVVAVKNEVKEILVFLNRIKRNTSPKIIAANLDSSEPECTFYFDAISSAQSHYSEPEKFLYIPNNALLKTGAFNWVSEKFGLKKLHPNTHLYTSDEKTQDFPGRILEIETIEAKALQKNEHYNIISKNHPLKPEEIKKKYKLKDGGERYLIFCQSLKNKYILRSKG